MKDWAPDKAWSDRFLPEIKGALGVALFGVAPIDEDQCHNTDLGLVLGLNAVRIACRIRRHEHLERYGDQFTIRAGRPTGAKTELTKIIEGWGDYLFYGFADEDEAALAAWFIGDLKVFRLWFNRQLVEHHGVVPGMRLPNSDNSSWFLAFRLADMPDGFVIARKNQEVVF